MNIEVQRLNSLNDPTKKNLDGFITIPAHAVGSEFIDQQTLDNVIK